ncbi:MAG: exosome non-catalytic core subunit rrp40 [Caeruleum heppii]|nr:MAG: exosome non-catalytic core subunit rrp40 [Caeruleum heppii]
MSVLDIVLPGDPISHDRLPPTANSSAPLKLGPGLRHLPPDTIAPTRAGELCVDRKKKALWVEHNGGRYIPNLGDTVLATVHHSSQDFYHCAITPFTSLATLPQLAFAGATRKTRPILSPGSLVNARVSLANKHMEPELECFNPSTGKANGLGELKGGMLVDISLGMARRLLMPDTVGQAGLVVLEELADKIPFEIAVGRNGKMWVDARDIRRTLAVRKAIIETDRNVLGLQEQKQLVKKILKAI